jgi:hypothetical protein
MSGHTLPNLSKITDPSLQLLFLYKRPGHRVLVNKLGDLVVRPSYVETAIRGVPGGASVRDHLLTQVRQWGAASTRCPAIRPPHCFLPGRSAAQSLASHSLLHTLFMWLDPQWRMESARPVAC